MAITNCVQGARFAAAAAAIASWSPPVSIDFDCVFQSSAPATSVEAAPPSPLRSATICGIPVIGYLSAITAPMPPPISPASPSITRGHEPFRATLPTTSCSKPAAIRAIAMPAAPR